MRIFFLLVLFVHFITISTGAKSVDVGGSHGVRSIKEALVLATDGDTIRINSGHYKEGNIIIDKRLVLIGVNWPILDGEWKEEVLSIKASGTVVKGMVIQNSGVSSIRDLAGIKIYDCNDVCIEGNKLKNTFFGIYTQYGKRCRIINNQLEGKGGEEQQCGNGIHCWKADSMLIVGNTISKHRDGIYFEFVTGSTIWKNYSFHNIRYGLHFMFSNNDFYYTNIFEENGAGVAVMFSRGVHMYGNVFMKNWGDAAYGILLKEISDSHVEGNYFVQNTSGIYMEGASRVQMKRNRFEANGWGLKIQASCMDINMKDCSFYSNSFDVATNGTLVLNRFNGNYWDNYQGYDLNKDGYGDVLYRPVSMYGYVVERNPSAMLLFRSLITLIMDSSERVVPSITPVNLIDEHPLMNPVV